MRTNTWLALTLVLMSSVLVNCSEAGFGSKSVNGSNTPTDTNPPPPPPPGVEIPRVTFIGPPCLPNTTCVAQFQLDRAYTQAVTFNWRTDDDLYLETPPAGSNYIFGMPDTHYERANGIVVFAPGQTFQQVFIVNKNQTPQAIVIGLVLSLCQYGTASYSCTQFFY